MLKRLNRLGRELGRETRAALRQGHLIATAGRPATERGPRHVVFVHGFMAHGRVFAPLRAHIERETGHTTSEVSYGPLERFEVVAERVARELDEAARHGPIAAVGHSLGGLLLRWSVQVLGAGPSVERLITLATPHRGTAAAKVGIVPLAKAIAPGSPILNELDRTTERAAHIATTALVAGADRMILPPASAALPGAEVHWLDGVGHNEMLFHPEVFAKVVGALQRPRRG